MESKRFKITLALTWLVGRTFATPQPSSSWTIGEIVKTTSGSVEGHPSKLHSEVSEYLGIPYAQPPTGDLRFAAPKKLEAKESNLIKAVQYGPDCPAPVGSSPGQQISYASVGWTVAGIVINWS
jgi:hypothetical protein